MLAMPEASSPEMGAMARQGGRAAGRERARATRRRVVEAAYRLFAERGYSVPLTAVAAQAGVAVQTVYFTFHTKVDLMREVLTFAVLGDDLPLAPHQRPWFEKLKDEPDPTKALRHMVDGTADIFERVAPLVGLFQTADPELAEIWAVAEKLRLEGYRSPVMETLVKKGRLKAGLDLDSATDILFVLLSPEMYREVVGKRSWPHDRWRNWTADLVSGALFD
jgi:AcrR family transcriptional regulator